MRPWGIVDGMRYGALSLKYSTYTRDRTGGSPVQESQFAGGQFIHRANQVDLLGLDRLFPRGNRRELFHRPADVGFDGGLELLLWCAAWQWFGKSGLDEVDQCLDAWHFFLGCFQGFKCCCNRTAALMSQDNHKARAEMCDRIRQASDDIRGDDVARDPHHKKIAESLVENQFHGHAGVAAPEDGGERFL